MTWIRTFLTVSCLLPLLEAQQQCTQHIRWGSLLQALMSMGSGISEGCVQHYNKDSLCDPAHMLNQVELNAELLVDIMKKTESIYRKNPSPQDFIQGLQHTCHILTPCAPHPHHAGHESVATCFNKLESFIHQKMSHTSCAWEIVNVTVRELLQRLEKRTFRRHH
ncbi:uncharacterized protein ifnu [Brachyhypopomus gauderio]|uniref:uncharacterized protein ifnu n=1 Tax=Brachyhypopomus gauderio TaxID=698409 RepID=UPI004042AC15